MVKSLGFDYASVKKMTKGDRLNFLEIHNKALEKE